MANNIYTKTIGDSFKINFWLPFTASIMVFKCISLPAIIVLILISWPQTGHASVDNQFIDEMIESLQNAINYYKRDLPDLIVDTAFCLFHTKGKLYCYD